MLVICFYDVREGLLRRNYRKQFFIKIKVIRICLFNYDMLIAISVRKSLRISAKTFFFGDHLLLVGKFAISVRKSLRISAKTFFSFFWRSPAFGRKICDFGQKKPSDFGEDLFFFLRSPVISARKIRRKPCPPDFNFVPPPPRFREAGDALAAFTHVSFAWPFCFCVLKNLQKSTLLKLNFAHS